MEDTREVEANLLRKNSSSSSSSIPLSVDTEGERDSDDVYVSEESSSRDPHYYLTHFMSSVSHVISSVDGHVIIKEKLDILSSFKEADVRSQQLLVRLYLRKHRWIRVDKLSYPEISCDLGPSIEELVRRNLLDDESSLTDPSDILSLLQVNELKCLKEHLHLPSSFTNLSKNQFITSVLQYCAKQKPLLPHLSPLLALKKRAKLLLGGCVCVSELCVNVFSQVLLLFSLITSGGLPEEETLPQTLVYHMLQVNRGQIIYPDYSINVSKPLFESCGDFEKFYSSYVLFQRLSSLVSLKGLTSSLLREIVEEACGLLESEVAAHACVSMEAVHGGGRSDEERNGLEELLHTGTSTSVKRRKKRNDKKATTKKRKLSTLSEAGNTVIDLTCDSDDGEEEEELDKVESQTTLFNRHCSCYPRSWRLRYNPGSVCVSVLSLCMESWEKLRDYVEANRLLVLLLSQSVFGYYKRGHWWERLALNLDSHLKEKSKSLHCITMAFKDPSVTDSVKFTLFQRAMKLCAGTTDNPLLQSLPSLNIQEPKEVLLTGVRQPNTPLFIIQDHVSPSSSSSSSSSSSLSLCSVEGFAIHHYTNVDGWPRALHLEGTIFTSLFILLLWDIVYKSEVPDVFRGPYQIAPLDFGREEFYLSRKSLIDSRLEWIRTSNIEDVMESVSSCWNNAVGESAVGIIWEAFPNGLEDALGLVKCFGTMVLSLLCEVFSREYYRSRGGVPDLVLWDPLKKTCKFVEVKGPGDRLSSKQRVWISRLSDWGCQVEVCRVEGHIETQDNSAYSHPPPATHSLSISTNTITSTQEGTEPIVLYEEIML